MPDKKENPKNNNFLGLSGLSGKSVTGMRFWLEGSTAIVEISFSGGSTFVKVRGVEAEVGGTELWGSGTKL